LNIFNDDSNFIYLLNAMGVEITINNIVVQALISNIKDKTIDYKKIKTIVEFKTGDIVTYQDSKWIIVSEVSKTNTIYKSTMRKCNNNLKYKVNLDGVDTIYSISCIAEKGTVSIDENKYFNTADNQLAINVPYSLINYIQPIIDSTATLRFFINGKCWQVLGIDNISQMNYEKQGVIIIKLESSLVRAEDNEEEGLAFNDPIIIVTPHTYAITSKNTNMTIENTRTSPISGIVCTRDGIEVISPTLTYVSSNEAIATIDSTGVISAIALGSTNITITYFNVSVTIAIAIIEKVELYSLVGNSSVNEAISQNYKMVNESQVDSTLEYTFSISDITLATIESSGINFINLLGANIEGVVILSATNIATSEVYTKSINTLFNQHTFTIVPNVTTVDIVKGQTLQITTICTDDGVEVVSPIVSYVSGATNYASVDATGLITAVLEGTTIITCSYEGVEAIISINVTAIPSRTFYINGADNLTSSVTQLYKITGSDEVDELTTLFTLSLVKYDSNTPINLITIKSSGTNSISFLGKTGMSGTFTLKATQKTDTSVILLKNIRVN